VGSLFYPISSVALAFNWELNELFLFTASAHTGDHIVDEYPDISGITTARVRILLRNGGNIG